MNIIRKPAEPNSAGASRGHIVFKLLPYWPLFLGLFILSVLAALIYLKMTPPVYEANARILINERKGDTEVKADEPMSTNLSSKQTVDNEREVIVSNPVIYKVVEDLGLYSSVYIKDGLSSTVMYKNAPLKVIVQNPNTLTPIKKTTFKIEGGKVVIDGKIYPFDRWMNMPYGTIMFRLNPSYNADNEGSFSFALTSPKKVVASIMQNIKVTEANKLSTILNISLLDQDSRRAEDILNDILHVYSASAIEQHNLLAANTQEFINKRLMSVEKELLDIESKLQNYRSERGAVDVGTQGRLYLENVSVNDQKVGEINMQLSVLNQIESYVKSKDLSGGIVPSTAGINDPGLSQMVKDIYELQLTAESLRKTTGENNPMVVSYVDQINKIKPQILQNLKNQRSSLSASRNNLASTTSNYSSVLQAMPETERNLVDINRQQQIKSGIYTFLLQKKEETALSYITNGTDNKIISSAESSEFPVSPKRKMVLLAAVFGAGILGIAFVSVKEGMRRNVMFQSEIKSLTALPVIAEISTNQTKNHIVIGSQQRTLIAEQFRSLRTTLHYLGIGKKNKRVMVTSAIAGEGKSFVA
ncbi:MAG: capsular biosynthesis protein, partial [Pedobacter sp.]